MYYKNEGDRCNDLLLPLGVFTPTLEWGGVICPQQQIETKEEMKEWERWKFYNTLLFGNAQYYFGKVIYHIWWLFPKKPQDAVFFAFSLQIFATFFKNFSQNLLTNIL